MVISFLFFAPAKRKTAGIAPAVFRIVMP